MNLIILLWWHALKIRRSNIKVLFAWSPALYLLSRGRFSWHFNRCMYTLIALLCKLNILFASDSQLRMLGQKQDLIIGILCLSLVRCYGMILCRFRWFALAFCCRLISQCGICVLHFTKLIIIDFLLAQTHFSLISRGSWRRVKGLSLRWQSTIVNELLF